MTFLEAWNAGCVLVVNKKWGGDFKDPVVKIGENCLGVTDAAELVTVLKSDPRIFKDYVKAGQKQLALYSPAVIVKKMEATFTK